MKKFLKIAAAALLITFILVLMFNIFQPKPFKFESFKTAEEAKSYLDERYLGQDISKVLKDVSLAGAECKERSEKISKREMAIQIDEEYEKIFVCKYWNNIISWDPFGIYVLELYADNARKLVGIFVRKKTKLQVP